MTRPDAVGRTPGRTAVASAGVAPLLRPRTAMVGRQHEREALAACAQALVQASRSATVLIMGEAGIGKSRLLDAAASQAEAMGVRVLRGAGDGRNRNEPYHAWHGVLGACFGLLPEDAAATRGLKVDAVLADVPGVDRRLRGLLDAAVGLDLASEPLPASLSGEARAGATQALVTRVLQAGAATRPTALVLEDAHWFDSASWALLRAIRMSVQPLLSVLASRPTQPPLSELAALTADPSVRTLALTSLGREDAGQLACQRLGVRSLPPAAIELLHTRAGGNALFVEELALVLRDDGWLSVAGGEARLVRPLDDLALAELPATVEGLIVRRVDKLQDRQKLVVHVASVIGRSFAVDVLQGVHPQPLDRAAVPGLMPELLDRDLIRAGGADLEALDPGEYQFKHVRTQEAVYGQMQTDQRRGLHRAVAEWYEREPDRSHNLPLLAHHWQKAEDWPRAVTYLEQAAGQNLDRYANLEVVDLLTQALALAAAHPVDAPAGRRAHWHRHLAEAWFRLGHLDSAGHHGREALRLWGRPVPSTLPGFLTGVLGQTVLRLLQRRWPGRFQVLAREGRDLRIAATQVLNRLTERHIYAEHALGCLDSGLRELNVAEPAGASPELGRAYAVMAVVLGTVPPLRGLARAWAERAIAVTEASAGQVAVLAYVLSRVAIVDLYDARWPASFARLQRAADVAKAHGDRRLNEEAVGVLGITRFYAGQFRESLPLFEAMEASAHFSNNIQIQAWAHFGIAAYHLRAGEATVALDRLALTSGWMQKSASNSEVLWGNGLLALAWLRVGNAAQAEATADAILHLVRKRPVAYWVQQSLAAVAEVDLDLWQQAPVASARRAGLRRKAAWACLGMRRFGATFAFGRPHALLWDGLRLWQDGKPAAAMAHWQACIALAEDLGMPWEAALARREIGRHLPEQSGERQTWLDGACRGLQSLGATWDFAVANEARRASADHAASGG